MSLRLYSGGEVHKVWGETWPKRSGGQLRERNRCSSPLSVLQLRQEGRVSVWAGGLVSVLLLGWDLSDTNSWDQRRSLLVVVLREPEHFFMLRSNIMGYVLPKGSKPSFASASLPKQIHLQLTEDRQTWKQQQNVPPNRPLQSSETAWKSKAQTERKRLSGGSRNPRLALSFPLGSPHELGGPKRATACLHDSWCLQMNIQALWKNPMELLLPTDCNKSSSALEIKCYHFILHIDSVIVKLHAQEMACICNICHKNSSGWCDSTVYLLWYCSSLPGSMNVALAETCT